MVRIGSHDLRILVVKMRVSLITLCLVAGCGRLGFEAGAERCTCREGPCCHGCNIRSLEEAHVCDTFEELACDANACGASVMQRTRWRICQGDGPECTGEEQWDDDWRIVETCGGDAVCDAMANPSCQTCAHGCNAGACYPECNPSVEVCCDATGELECWPHPGSGLMWQIGASPSTTSNADARNYCDNLSRSGHTDWRLPTISELRSLVRGCPNLELPGGACQLTDTCLDLNTCWTDTECDCPPGPGPGIDGAFAPAELSGPWNCQDCFYWSASALDPPPAGRHVSIHFGVGLIGTPLNFIAYARCVRDPP